MFKEKNMGTGLKTEQESHMKILIIMYHRTNGHREKRISTQLDVRALLFFCSLVCTKKTHSLIKPNLQLPTVYKEHFCTAVIANREKNRRVFFFNQSEK